MQAGDTTGGGSRPPGRSRRLSSWAAALAVAAIVVFNVQGWWVLARTSRAFEAELGARLEAVATTLSAALGSRWQEPDAARLLRLVRAENELLNLFIVDDDLTLLLSLAGGPAEAGSAYRADLPELLAALSGAPAQSRVYRSGRLYLKSAYAPLLDSTGVVSAALGVEADARFFATLAGFRRSLVLVNLLGLLAIAGILLVSASLLRHALRLEQAAARANALALAGQLSAAVAHEVKNPLAIIRSTAERLKKQYGRGSDDPKFDYIQEEVDRLAQVVSNYLGVARTGPGESVPVDLGQLARETAQEVAVQAGRTRVAVSAAVTGAPRPVRGNRGELKQVLLNLALNGVQAQPGGGRVVLSVCEEDGEVVVRVKDDGPGVDRRTAQLVFEPFFTTREKGSGLGLYVVRRIVEAHRGRVRLANPGAAGAELELRLPVDRAGEAG
ncbi:MAG: HAMP domain-containing sensor histidine kinase [bacterium]